MNAKIYKQDPAWSEDRKHLGTEHTLCAVNEYYHVRRRRDGVSEFLFVMVRNTKTDVKEYLVEERDLPSDIKPN